jgi:hypothetical protein
LNGHEEQDEANPSHTGNFHFFPEDVDKDEELNRAGNQVREEEKINVKTIDIIGE